MTLTKVSTKGQIVLPKSVRASKKWGPGTELEIIDEPGQVVLRLPQRKKKYTIDDLIGVLKYDGPPKTLKEIEDGIARGAVARFARSAR